MKSMGTASALHARTAWPTSRRSSSDGSRTSARRYIVEGVRHSCVVNKEAANTPGDVLVHKRLGRPRTQGSVPPPTDVFAAPGRQTASARMRPALEVARAPISTATHSPGTAEDPCPSRSRRSTPRTLEQRCRVADDLALQQAPGRSRSRRGVRLGLGEAPAPLRHVARAPLRVRDSKHSARRQPLNAGQLEASHAGRARAPTRGLRRPDLAGPALFGRGATKQLRQVHLGVARLKASIDCPFESTLHFWLHHVHDEHGGVSADVVGRRKFDVVGACLDGNVTRCRELGDALG
jgi:hypothetical protein